MFLPIVSAAADCFGRIKAELAIEDTRPRHEVVKAFGGNRAWAYVKAAAVLERVVRDTLAELMRELNRSATPVDGLRVSLRGLLAEPELKSLRDLRAYEKVWRKRCELFRVAGATTPALFGVEVLPLDGRTLRPKHFDVVWEVFGLDGPSLPSPMHKLALTELADFRNDLAHGNVDPDDVQRMKTFADVTRMVGYTEEIAEHLLVSVEQYVNTRAYLG